jgi:non-ribosomal peptide synthetase-like protein
MFGDSSFIVYYLGAIGYKFKGLEQTGSNFGQSQRHENPLLCEIGKGTMVSDGLAMLNADYSTSAFRVSTVRIGTHNFLGNSIFYPAQGAVGDNCLLGTKVMVPTDGPVRTNVGLLGSPCFEIPRSVRRDGRFDFYKQPAVLRQRLNRKNVSNGVTMLFFLLSNCIALNVVIVTWYLTYPSLDQYGPLYLSVLAMCDLAVLTLYHILVDWASLGFRRLQPRYCSIYDQYFWRHERYWKLGMSNDQLLLGMLNGTPFKSLAWRALGVRVGEKLFDDGAAIPEKTLVEIGDYCTLNEHCVLQAHSLEDGVFKSDRIVIGDGCTIGANCYVHYGVRMGNDVNLEPDSFLMKGERPDARTSWCGNPAREMLA